MTDASPAKRAVRLRNRIYQDGRVLADLGMAASFLGAAVKLWDADLPPAVRSGLYQAATVSYARPFISVRSTTAKAPAYPMREIRNAEGFSRAIHDHLVSLRHQFLAHVDPDAYRPQLAFSRAKISRDDTGEVVEPVVGVVACTYGWDGVDDQSYVQAVAGHVAAVVRAVESAMDSRLVELLGILTEHPDSLTHDRAVPLQIQTTDSFQRGAVTSVRIDDIMHASVKGPDGEIGGPHYRYHLVTRHSMLNRVEARFSSGEVAVFEAAVKTQKRS